MKILIGALVGGAIVLAWFFFMNQPEPTTEQRLEGAAEKAGEAAKEAVGALKDAASEATNALEKSVTASTDDFAAKLETASAELAAGLDSTSTAARAELDKVMAEWKATGILTETGVDYDKAKEAIAAADLPEEAKAQVASILEFLKSAPGAFKDRFNEVEQALQN